MQQSPIKRNNHNNKLLFGIIAGIVLGALLGGLWPEAGLTLKFVGDLFIRFLMMIVMPLIIAAMVSGIARLGDISQLGSLGSRTLGYYIGTTALAVITGIVLVLWIQPGKAGLEHSKESITRSEAHDRIDGNTMPLDKRPAARFTQEKRSIGDVLKEVIGGLVPSNIFKAMANNEILPVITFSLLLGAALSMTGEAGRTAILFFNSLNEAMMKIIHLAMYVAPVGIGALIAGRLGEAGGFSGFWPELQQLGKYAATVIGGLAIHSLVTLPLLLKLFGKRSPSGYAIRTFPALLTAFSTASSTATLPLTIECAEEKNGISKRTAGFVLPLGATVNMDGTALYEAVAVLFIAQMNGIALGTPELLVVFLTATLAAVGAAGIPEAGLVTMVLVLKAVNLPVEGIALILAIDWFLDRCRTTVNVWGDSVGAGIIDRKVKG